RGAGGPRGGGGPAEGPATQLDRRGSAPPDRVGVDVQHGGRGGHAVHRAEEAANRLAPALRRHVGRHDDGVRLVILGQRIGVAGRGQPGPRVVGGVDRRFGGGGGAGRSAGGGRGAQRCIAG